MKNALRIVFVALLASCALAQISLNQSNVPSAGQSISDFDTPSDVDWAPGSGSNQNWNISSFGFSVTGTFTYVSPTGTPFQSTFPNANLCQTGGNDYTYFRSASNGFYLEGFAIQTDTVPFIQQPDAEVMFIPFPCTMGANWTSVARYTYELFPGFVSTTVDSELYSVDGWGNMTTPMWTAAALRVSAHGYFKTYLNGTPIGDPTEDWGYQFLTQNGSRGASYSSSDATGPNFTTGSLSYSSDGTIDVGPVRGPVAQNFSVSQNYPNPFNPTTNLPIELSKNSTVEVTIYNEVGQVVEHMTQDLSAGSHSLPIDGSSWSTGSYFANVKAGEESQTTRMLLVK